MKNLNNYVKNWISNTPTDEQEDSIKHALEYGCVSGSVTELIYYADTLKFYEDHKEEINNLLSNTLIELGCTAPVELFGNKWDEKDTLVLDTNNQNLLTWFAFEETLRRVAEELEIV
jgi:hypothetical protein